MDVELIKVSENCLKDILESAIRIFPKIKLKSGDEERQKLLISKCIRSGEVSVFTHAIATVEFSCSLIVARELESYSFDITQRTHFDTEELSFIIPPIIESNEQANIIFSKLMKKVICTYEALSVLDEEFDYRYILPGAVNTTVLVTSNFLEWLKILKLERYTKTSQELKDLCSEFYAVLNEICPLIFNKANLKSKI